MSFYSFKIFIHIQQLTGRPSSVSDFRPISLLSVLSKVLERLVTRILILPLIKDCVQQSQFAFIPRPGSGTTSALVSAQHQIIKFLDSSSGCVRLLSLDLSKAFDKIPHDVILNACDNFHLPLSVVKWVSSFLSDRSQCVLLDGLSSSWIRICSGVPQGSVIGPLLFALAVHISPVCSNSSMIKYADDILLLHFTRSPSDDMLQLEWNNLVQLSNSLQLPINYSKCQVMDIITKSSLQVSPVVDSTSSFVPQVSSMKFLGVFFSSTLKWNLHIDFIIRKVSKRLSGVCLSC